MSQPFKLFRLQQTDSQLDQARQRVLDIDQILQNNAALLEAQAQFQTAEGQQSESQMALKKAETEVQAQRIKIELTEATLYGGKVRNPKELQDLQNEAASLKKYLVVLEDRQLEHMLELEDAEAEFQQRSAELENVKAQLITQHASLQGEKTSLLKDIARLELERHATISTIPGEELQLYEQLRLQRRGVAVSRISDNACSACGSILTPGLVQAARTSGQICRCTFCNRILYAG